MWCGDSACEDKLKELTGGESFKSNVELALNNARVAAQIAVEYAKN